MRLTRTLALGVALGVAYVRFLRSPILNWGATSAETDARLPGDELLADPDTVATRAIDINAPASAVWPWIAQMGPSPRGGAYTYDWIENLLGLNMHSVDHVLPEFQNPKIGDTIGYGSNRMRLERVEPERVLAWRSEDGNWVWTFVLEEARGRRGSSVATGSAFHRSSLESACSRWSLVRSSWSGRCSTASSTAQNGSLVRRGNDEPPMMRAPTLITGVALVVGAIWLRRVGHRSGVTDFETRATLAGDDLVPEPMWQSTRGITIDAAPEAIWPWLAQMGFPAHRGGWYTPHLLDLLTFGIRERSADEIVDEFQHVEVGDRIPDSADWSVFFTVAEVDPPQALVLHSTRHVLKPIRTIDFSWAFVVREGSTVGRSKLFIRARARYSPRWARLFAELVIGPADFVNAGGMLRGIRRRVESPSPLPRSGLARPTR